MKSAWRLAESRPPHMSAMSDEALDSKEDSEPTESAAVAMAAHLESKTDWLSAAR